MPDDVLELNYGGRTIERYDVGTDRQGRGIAIRHTDEADGEHWRFSHVCDRQARLPGSTLIIRIAPDVQLPPQYPTGHTLMSIEPLHIEPSILCSDCGLHGWVRDGRWVTA